MAQMRPGQITLPVLCNDGKTPLAQTHQRLASLLLAAFDGCTAVFGSGMWNHPEKGTQVEEVYVYTVAYVPSDSGDVALRAIATTIGQEAGQDAMYVQYASGIVDIVPMVKWAPLQAINDNQPGVIPFEGRA